MTPDAGQYCLRIRGTLTAVAVPSHGTLTRLRLEFNGTRSLL